MSETENDYVATATAEKRLREVLEMRYDGTGVNVDTLAEILLGEAKIEYLPRKKSVSITLVVPANGTIRKTSLTVEQQHIAQYGDKQSYDEAQLARVYGGEPEQIDHPAPSEVPAVDTPAEPRVARFGVFEPTVTSAPEYHEDDYFVE